MNRDPGRALNLPALDSGYRTGSGADLPVSSAPTALDRWVPRAMLRALSGPRIAITLWDGTEARGTSEPPVATVVIRDRAALWRLTMNPLLYFGDLYSQGRIDVEGDLVAGLEQVYAGVERGRSTSGSSWWHLWRNRAPRSTDPTSARDNIHHHYDLGNQFYELWLDRDLMQYTCAYFAEPDLTLEAAQRAKIDHVARKLRLRPGQRVVEAGGGWGGFAVHLAARYGVWVRSYNISREQVRYATEFARRQGLADRVDFVEDDYRNIRGEYDVFVSIGMLEHVGRTHYHQLGAVVDRCLKPQGLGLIHTIGRNRPGNMNAWIERRIFPGAYPPSIGEMMEVFEPFDFSVLDLENLRLHYAETLRLWKARFDRAEDAVREMYDTDFVRAWRLYLAGSIASFTTGSLQLFQVLFARGTNNDVPLTRRDLYVDAG
jgi:cyclopropane-fatty-acyl-phospholipid synthase